MKRATKVVAMAAVVLVGQALAVVPESGLWYNPDEPGRGYGVEVQDDRVFVTYYAFQPDGQKSAFYTTFGTLNANTGVVTGYFAAAENGQCFGCTWRNPQLTDLGQARLQFTSPTAGRITLPGNVQIPIQRQLMYGSHMQDRQVIKGAWAITFGALGLYFGDVLYFHRDEASQPNGVSGSRLDAPSRVLLGRSTNDPALPAYLVLVDSSTSYYQATAFDNSVGQLAGRTWTYPKTGQISGAGLPTFGYKIMGLRTIQSLPNATLGLEKSELDALAKDHAMHQASASAQFDGESPGEVMIGEKSVSVDALRAIFQQMEDGLR